MRKKAISQARIKANKRWDEKALDRMSFTVPKGQKATIQQYAYMAGESVNKYTQKALLLRMGLEGWPLSELQSNNNVD